MNIFTEKIKEYYDKQNIDIKISEFDELDRISIISDCDNIKNIKSYIFVYKNNDSIIRCEIPELLVIPEDKYFDILEIANKINSMSDFVSVNIRNNLLYIRAGAIVDENSVAEVADKILNICLFILDHEYASIMKAIWSDKE